MILLYWFLKFRPAALTAEFLLAVSNMPANSSSQRILCSSETFPCRNITLHTYISNIASCIAHIHISFQRLKKTTSCSLIILNLCSAVLTLFFGCEWASAFVLVFSGKPVCLCSKMMKTPYLVGCKIDLVSNVLMSLTFSHCERAQLVTLQHFTVCFWVER